MEDNIYWLEDDSKLESIRLEVVTMGGSDCVH